MPFGFERMEMPESTPKADEYKRIYVEVNCLNKKDGKLVPISIIWYDGRSFNINKVLECRLGRSLKYRTSGCRYKCQIGNKQFYLFFTGERWYVELRS